MTDWLDDLSEFSAMDIAEACKIWRRQPGSKRPLPGDIRALAVQMKRDRAEASRPLMLPDYSKMEAMDATKRQRVEAAREWRQKRAEEHGCVNFAHVMDIGIRNVEARSTGKPIAPDSGWRRPAREESPPMPRQRGDEE